MGWTDYLNPVDDLKKVGKWANDKLGNPLGALTNVLSTPNNYDATGQMTKSEAMSGGVYSRAAGLANEAHDGPTLNPVTAQATTAGKPITAQIIGKPNLLVGQQASALRDAQLDQAQAAANSPSSAAAQMRAAGTQIEQQQAGMAAQARGQDRASARRDAMLATGTQGMQAASQTAVLAAQEQAAKQQAYTQALAGVRAGDVSNVQTQTQIGAQNQAADLQAQQATASNKLNTGQFNATNDLQAQQANNANALAGYQEKNNAINQAYGTELQAVGATNQAAGVASNYATGLNTAQMQNRNTLLGAAGGLLGVSDESAKTDISPVGRSSADKFGGILAGAYGMPGTGAAASPYAAATGEDFLKWQPTPAAAPQQQQQGGGGLGAIAGVGLGSLLSDKRAKQEVDHMSTDDIADFTRSNPLV